MLINQTNLGGNGEDLNDAPATTTIALTVKKADPCLSVSTAFNKTYGDADFELNATKAEGSGARSYAVKSGESVSVDENGKVTILEAGTSTITVSVAENENYKSDSKDVTVTVASKPISGATVNLGKTLIYNGQELTQNVSKVVLNGKEITFEVENNKAIAAGTSELTIKGTGNYSGEIKVKYVIVALDEKVDEIGAGTSGEIKMAVSVGEKAPATTIQSSKSEMIWISVSLRSLPANPVRHRLRKQESRFVSKLRFRKKCSTGTVL